MPKYPCKIEIYRREAGERVFDRRIQLPEPGIYALGRDPGATIRLDDPKVSREHLELELGEDTLIVRDLGSSNGTFLKGRRIETAAWDDSAPIELGGGYELVLLETGDSPADADYYIESVSPDSDLKALEDLMTAAPQVPVSLLRSQGYLSGETDFLAAGGGLGSFTWVDYLRIFGIGPSNIAVIGDNPVCYANYERYCRNSQIPGHERLRSNSTSTPDNIWGFPGYASREAFRALARADVTKLGHVFAVFGEPTFAQSYVPVSSNVFRSLDREMARIGWPDMFIHARIFRIRMTDDGRYAVAYRRLGAARGRDRIGVHVARYLHIATGYPRVRLVEDLEKARVEYPEARHRIVNAYYEHDSVYDELAGRQGATVVIRGRGIVASRVFQRIVAERDQKGADIQVVHVMSSPRRHGTGARFNKARRPVFNDVEIQPFNWPKACWGGVLRRDIEDGSHQDRARVFSDLGGTTTASRKDWTEIIERGTEEGWYKKAYGRIRSMTRAESGDQIVISVERHGKVRQTDTYFTDFIIDCTGLIADLKLSSLLSDLIETYHLPRNVARPADTGRPAVLAGFAVSDHFEIESLRNGAGRVYTSGQLAAGGPYAPVDSFLGLQYAALRSVDHLSTDTSTPVAPFGPFRSAGNWIKWCFNTKP